MIPHGREGQSLIELLIALAFGTLVLLTSFGLLQFLIRLGATDPVMQTGGFIARQAAHSAAAAAEGSWNAVGQAATGTPYHAATSTGGFVLVLGVATSTVNGIAYGSSITVEAVQRDAATDEIVESGGVDDPGTKKVAATVSWTYQGKPYAETIVRYVARTGSEFSVQTDWSGEATSSSDPVVPASGSLTQFYGVYSGTVDYSTVPGSIKISGY